MNKLAYVHTSIGTCTTFLFGTIRAFYLKFPPTKQLHFFLWSSSWSHPELIIHVWFVLSLFPWYHSNFFHKNSKKYSPNQQISTEWLRRWHIFQYKNFWVSFWLSFRRMRCIWTWFWTTCLRQCIECPAITAEPSRSSPWSTWRYECLLANTVGYC